MTTPKPLLAQTFHAMQLRQEVEARFRDHWLKLVSSCVWSLLGCSCIVRGQRMTFWSCPSLGWTCWNDQNSRDLQAENFLSDLLVFTLNPFEFSTSCAEVKWLCLHVDCSHWMTFTDWLCADRSFAWRNFYEFLQQLLVIFFNLSLSYCLLICTDFLLIAEKAFLVVNSKQSSCASHIVLVGNLIQFFTV